MARDSIDLNLVIEEMRRLSGKVDAVGDRMDRKLDTLSQRMDSKIDTVRIGLDKKVDDLENKSHKVEVETRRDIGKLQVKAGIWGAISGLLATAAAYAAHALKGQ